MNSRKSAATVRPPARSRRGVAVRVLVALGALALLATALLLLPGVRAPVSRALDGLPGGSGLKAQVKGLLQQGRLAWEQAAGQTPIPYAEPAELVPVAHTGVYPYGVNVFFEQEVEEWKLRRSMEVLREMGIRWVRQQVPWERIEPERKGDFTSVYGSTWAQFDRVLPLAQEYGLEVLARLDLPPPWARSNPAIPASAPARIEDYGDFVEAFVRRYRGRVRYLQVWNEPNLVGEWGGPPDAARYVALLREAYTRIKAVDPAIVVLSASLAPTLGTPDGLNQSDLTYLQAMYDVGAAPYFDILGAQGYGLWTGPDDRRVSPDHVNMSRAQLLRGIMVRNGDARKAIWITEYGWNALPPEFPGEATHGRVTEEEQARYTVEGLRRIQQEWPWVGAVFTWHFRRVSDEDRDQVMFYYRLMDPDFTPRPVFHALRDLIRREPVVERGWFQEDHWALRYQGEWRQAESPDALLGGYRQPQPGAALEFTFRGTDLSLVLLAGPEGGRFQVAVDGAVPERLVLEARAPEPRSAIVAVVRGLPDGLHRVRLEAEGAPGAWGLDGFLVERTP
ncbi:MAG: hypothetical protein HY689_08035 [Chloroflexi bacterium]|nr:hypothetical protein [Chloroflexota bacterium]